LRPSETEAQQARGVEGYLLSVLQGSPGFVPGLLRTALAALAPIYCAGLKLYLLPYRIGIRKRFRLPCPTLCVGNLTTGGTGKTPMTQTLCRLLQQHGFRVVILSRGYGGKNEYGCAIVSDGERLLLTSEEAGDEAYLLAKTLPGIPVIVGKDRRVTGKLACERFRPDLIVLDDGLQFWQLHRDLDLVLLNACAPFDNGWTFPRGLLREPPSHLRRAGIVVLTHAQEAGPETLRALQIRVARLAPNRPCFTANLVPVGLRSVGDKVEYTADHLHGMRVVALCALGNPTGFESTLRGLGGNIVQAFRFRDHVAITLSDLERVSQEAKAQNAGAVVTTEKDVVKLPSVSTQLPLLALEVRLQIDSESELLREVIRICRLEAGAAR